MRLREDMSWARVGGFRSWVLNNVELILYPLVLWIFIYIYLFEFRDAW